jgi:hypothetical protein
MKYSFSSILFLFFFACSSFAQNITGLHPKEHDECCIGLTNSFTEKLPAFTNKRFHTKSGSLYHDTTDECNMILNDGILIKNVRLLDVTDSTFTITKSSVNRVFPLGKLSRVTFVNHGFWKGFAAGAIASVAFWGILGAVSYHGGGHPDFGPSFGLLIGLVLAAPTGLVTGIIGEFSVTDDVYDFVNINPLSRPNRLRSIIREHKK